MYRKTSPMQGWEWRALRSSLNGSGRQERELAGIIATERFIAWARLRGAAGAAPLQGSDLLLQYETRGHTRPGAPGPPTTMEHRLFALFGE